LAEGILRAYDAVNAYDDVVAYDDVPLNCELIFPIKVLNDEVNKYMLVAEAGMLRALSAIVAWEAVP
jgi:hypothetical protein